MSEKTKRAPGSGEANAALLRHWMENGWAAGNPDLADKCFHRDFIAHDPDFPFRGIEPLKEAARLSRGALDDLEFRYGDFIATDDRIGTSFSVRAKHVGPYLGIPPSGKTIEFHGTVVLRVVDGKFKEGWQTVDMSNVLREAGVAANVPAPPRAPTPDWATRWHLAPRHAQTARLMMEGLSDGEIALHMGLSLHTARTYARFVLRAAGVQSRLELARAAGTHHAG